MKQQNKDRVIMVKLTEEDYSKVSKQASTLGIGKGTLIRMALKKQVATEEFSA